jgi:hypothetical protein
VVQLPGAAEDRGVCGAEAPVARGPPRRSPAARPTRPPTPRGTRCAGNPCGRAVRPSAGANRGRAAGTCARRTDACPPAGRASLPGRRRPRRTSAVRSRRCPPRPRCRPWGIPRRRQAVRWRRSSERTVASTWDSSMAASARCREAGWEPARVHRIGCACPADVKTAPSARPVSAPRHSPRAAAARPPPGATPGCAGSRWPRGARSRRRAWYAR